MCGILLIGHDRWLLQTRALILKSTRANVFTSDPKGFEEITSDQQIDLLILCHTLSEATRHSVSAEAHRRLKFASSRCRRTTTVPRCQSGMRTTWFHRAIRVNW